MLCSFYCICWSASVWQALLKRKCKVRHFSGNFPNFVVNFVSLKNKLYKVTVGDNDEKKKERKI